MTPYRPSAWLTGNPSPIRFSVFRGGPATAGRGNVRIANRPEQRSVKTNGWTWRNGKQHTCSMISATVNPLSAPYSRRDLIKWWEARRLRFNLLVGAVGLVTWLLVLFVGSLAVKPGEDFEEPFMMIIGPIMYGIFTNLCYSLGWIVDTMSYRGHPRVFLYKAGVIFLLILTALPGIWAVVAWCITLHTGKRLG